MRIYYQVETATCGLYWLFRLGDGVNPSTGPISWFVHWASA